MERSFLSLSTLLFYLLYISTARSEFGIARHDFNADIQNIVLRIDGEDHELPLLPDLQTRLEFPVKDIEEAYLLPRNSDGVDCIFWSDEDFAFNLVDNDLFYIEKSNPFRNVNRVYCYDAEEVGRLVMVEDTFGNQEIIPLEKAADGLHVAGLRRPLNVARATSLTYILECRFQSRRTFSAEFEYKKPFDGPFKGAIAVYCREIRRSAP